MRTPIQRITEPMDRSVDAQRVGSFVRERILEQVAGVDPVLMSIDAQTRSDHFAVYVFVAQMNLIEAVTQLCDGIEAELREFGIRASVFVRTWTTSRVA